MVFKTPEESVLDLLDDPGIVGAAPDFLVYVPKKGESPARRSATVQRQDCFFGVEVPVPIVVCDHFVWPRGWIVSTSYEAVGS
jgi:hypothetical protein